MDPSVSMMIDKRSNTASDYSTVAAQSPQQWVDDDAGICYQCKTAVGIGLLGSNRSHCRLCGRLHCSQCSNHFAIIPHYIKVPKPSKKHAKEDLTKPVRLCAPCFTRVEKATNMAPAPGGGGGGGGGVANEKSLDVFDLNRRAQSNDSFERQYANFKLSSFRSIQYYLVDHPFTQEERDMLWINRQYFGGHAIWIVQLLRSLDYEMITPAQVADIEQVLCAPKTVACRSLMCTRTCGAFTVESAIQLLNQRMRCDSVRKFALQVLEQCPEEELQCLIPYLVRHSIYAKVVYAWLIEQCTKSDAIATEVYRALQVYLIPDPRRYAEVSPTTFDIIHEALSDWKRVVSPAVREKVHSAEILVNTIRATYWKAGPASVNFTKYTNFGFFVPSGVESVRVCECRVLDSATAPILLKVYPSSLPTLWTMRQLASIVSKDTNGTKDTVPHGTKDTTSTTRSGTTLSPTIEAACASHLWKPEDVRKDQIVMSIIRMVGIVVKRDEGIDLPLVTYNVCPMSAGDGFIEMVPRCATLHHIKNELNMDLLAWLVDQNPNIPGGELRERFMKSCAAYCVITYLLGVGDRHLENIMLRSDGAFFHIDYGFILGQDPKPLKKPPIRVTEDMLTVLGGKQSEMYRRFAALCIRINSCLRRHINLFVSMLRMLVDAHPPIGAFDEALLMDKIRQRFVPGETEEEAEIQLYSHLDKGVSTSYTVIDSLRSIRTPLRAAQTIVSTLWAVVPGTSVISRTRSK